MLTLTFRLPYDPIPFSLQLAYVGRVTEHLDQTSPVDIIGPTRPGPWVITCDHATNRVPEEVGDLGLPPEDMARHIAYDIGARGVALHLGQVLNSPVVSSNFSRLVIDPNRGSDDPTLVMQLYDGSIIPGNRAVDQAETQRRITEYYQPYHTAVANVAANRDEAVVLAIHSFTPQLRGRPKRPWEIGILHAKDERFTTPLIAELRKDPTLTVGRNEPYSGFLRGDAIDRHAIQHGRLNALIELRNDLIETPAQQVAWAERLAAPLKAALKLAKDGSDG